MRVIDFVARGQTHHRADEARESCAAQADSANESCQYFHWIALGELLVAGTLVVDVKLWSLCWVSVGSV